jgi:hypothetical protein
LESRITAHLRATDVFVSDWRSEQVT